MPNRILKESICTNEQIDGLTAFEETVFYRLIVICDDFGRFDGRISVLKGRMFPLRDDKLKTEALQKAMKSLVQAGLVKFYKAEGKPYLHLTGWERNQQRRAKFSKFPAPEDADLEEIPASEGNGNHLPSNDGGCGEEPAPEITPVQTPAEPAVISLPLNDGTLHGVTASEVKKYRELYLRPQIHRQPQAGRKRKAMIPSAPVLKNATRAATDRSSETTLTTGGGRRRWTV